MNTKRRLARIFIQGSKLIRTLKRIPPLTEFAKKIFDFKFTALGACFSFKTNQNDSK